MKNPLSFDKLEDRIPQSTAPEVPEVAGPAKDEVDLFFIQYIHLAEQKELEIQRITKMLVDYLATPED